MGNVVKLNRRLEVLYSGGVKGDIRPLPLVKETTDKSLAIKAMEQELNKVYMESYYFEGLFNDLGFDIGYYKKQTKQVYQIETGKIQNISNKFSYVLGLFMSSAYGFEMTDLAMINRATEQPKNVNTIRRNIFYIANNGFGDLYEKFSDLCLYYYDECINYLDSKNTVSLIIFILEIFIYLLCSVTILIPDMIKTHSINRKFLLFLL
jgi:hypothetical protein